MMWLRWFTSVSRDPPLYSLFSLSRVKDSKTKESIEKHEYITINDVRCAVVGGGPKVQNVLIHHYPFEEDNHRLWIALSSFGEVRDIQYQHYPDLCSISTGTRVVKMVRNSPIPRSRSFF